MELLEALKTRKSIRAFKADPVPRALLTEILEAAGVGPPLGAILNLGNWWW